MISLGLWRQRLGAGLLGSTAVAAVLLATPAWAQTAADTSAQNSDEIIVTAQRRAEASRDVPISVATLNADQLAAANVQSLGDTAKVTTSLRFDYQGTFAQPSIRGIGTAVTTSGGGPNVGIYVDGFFQSNPEVADFQLSRIRNVQVLKGPQGTLFGRNTTGGAILVTTEDPSNDPSLEVGASYGSFNTERFQAYATHGLGDHAAVDLEGIYRRGDGFQTNLLNNDDKVGAFENWSARAGLRLDLAENVTAVFRLIHSTTDDPTAEVTNSYVDSSGDARFFDAMSQAGRDALAGAYGYSSSQGHPLFNLNANFFPALTATDPDHVVLNPQVRFTNKTDAAQATLRWDLGWADLTSYSQYREDSAVNWEDLDGTGLELGSFLLIDVEDKTVSQEFLLNSNSEGPLQWTAGAAYYRNEDIWDVGIAFPGDVVPPFRPFGGSGTTTTSYAVFADATYEFMHNWFLTAGARYTDDKVSNAFFRMNLTTQAFEGPDGVLVPVSPADAFAGERIAVNDLHNSQVTPRVVLRYKPSENSSIYASFTRGYKAGILNVGGLSQVPVRPENIDAYEIGYKFDNRTFGVDLAAFDYDYQDLQVSSFQNAAAQIRNAASSKIYGVEAQGHYHVTQAFNLNAGVAWNHARYESFPNAPFYSYCDPTVVLPTQPLFCGALGPGAIAQTTTDASKLHMQRAPDYTANIGASYDLPLAGGEMTFSGNWYYTSSFYFDPSQQFKQDAYNVLSLRAQWTDPSARYTIAAFGDNVTDERYQTQVLFNTLGISSVWSQPATWGVEIKARY